MRRALLVLTLWFAAFACTTDPATTSGASPAVDPPLPPKKDAGPAPEAGGRVPDALDQPFVCAPAAQPSELYALEAVRLGGATPLSMCRFRGSVLLIVNVASACGFTPQYAPLQKVYDTYAARKFYVLGFPCNQFGAQESGTDKDISTFCTTKYGITFPMFTKIDVNGAATHPIYAWLKAQPGGAGDITWNFNKFLIGRDGKLIKRYPSETTPDAPDLTADIEAALAR